MKEAQIPTTYVAKEWEDKLYRAWEKSNFFNPDECIQAGISDDTKPVFSLVLPPPNVTGTLHVGHAAMLAIEDALIRYHRMKGDRTLWIPGTDHAAIATQSRVEKNLWEKEGKTRYAIGRDAFLERVKQFAKESHDTIIRQTKKMGSSLDWSREAYTLDEQRSIAVRAAFKKMYEDNIIYRGERIVNWDPKMQTTVSDDEIEYREQKTPLYYFQYGPFVISTARPETKFGDKYVVMHPDDTRYQQYKHGEKITVEWINGPVTATIIKDTSIDPSFGTGVMTITPWHDATDFDIAERHTLDKEPIIDEQGKLLPIAQEFAGLSIEEAREKIVEKLRAKGLLVKIEDQYTHNIAVNSRGGGNIEPQIKKQWFIAVSKTFQKNGKTTTLKALMQQAVTSGDVSILPERFTKTYFHWINNLRDWCISRQIWFGHRIPVWYCLSCNYEYVDAPVKAQWFIVRHGETQANAERITQGHSGDTPLTENGKQQVRAVAEQLRNHHIDLIISSDLGRCQQTAGIISEITGAPIELDPAFRERHYGEAEGMTYEAVREHYPHARVYHGTGNGIETYPAIEERVRAAFEKHREIHRQKNVVIVSHGGAIRMLIKHIKNLDPTEAVARPGIKNAEILSLDILETPCPQCGNDLFEQDPDTLDTWFSAGLWTFSTMGWPTHSGASVAGKPGPKNDFANYHPTTLIETGYDILFFWVARMIMMSQYLIGTRPFKTVYLHGLVRDAKGQKMSKSLGNIIDPLDISEQYGADALRMALLSGSTPGNDTKLSDDKIIAMRNFVNKLWNLARYVGTMSREPLVTNIHQPPKPVSMADHWILSRLETVVTEVTQHLEQYQLSLATETLREFTWGDFADWYVEIHKVEHNDALLRYVFDHILKLWHPFMPFVTEAIHQTFHFDKPKFLMIAKWPTPATENTKNPNEHRFVLFQELIVAIRNIRAEHHIDPARKITISVPILTESIIRDNEPVFKKLARVETIHTQKTKEAPQNTLLVQVAFIQIYLHLDDIIDTHKERARLEKEKSEKERFIVSLENTLSNPDFIERAKPAIVESTQKKLAEAKKELLELINHLSSLNT